MILYGVRNELSEEQFRVIADAALRAGDTDAYISFLGGYGGWGTPNDTLHPDFELADHLRFDLAMYPPRDFGDDWWKIIEHVIYSPHGAWGVMTSLEGYALAAGPASFREQLIESDIFAGSLERFLAEWKTARDRSEARTSWIPTLLDNLYGPSETDRVLANLNEPRETWSRNK